MNIHFFHVPSLGMYSLIEPVLLELAARGHRVVHYNAAEFRRYVRPGAIEFRAYADYGGYVPRAFSRDMRLDELGLLLLETAERTLAFVESEVMREAPDVVLHSKFTPAPKAIARTYHVPAACLIAGHALHPSVVRDEAHGARPPVTLAHVVSWRRFKRRAQAFYERHYPGGGIDEHDVFINEERTTLVLGLEQFQPRRDQIARHHTFVGPTIRLEGRVEAPDLIYVSLGSVFVDNRPLFASCIEALADVGRRVVISLGNGLTPADFPHVPAKIEVTSFAPQQALLPRAALFVTHGGASSVYEAIACATPMIVLPQIPEQVFYAREIERSGLGRCIEAAHLTVPRLRSAVLEMLHDDRFRRRAQRFNDSLPKEPAAVACRYIEAAARETAGGIHHD